MQSSLLKQLKESHVCASAIIRLVAVPHAARASVQGLSTRDAPEAASPGCPTAATVRPSLTVQRSASRSMPRHALQCAICQRVRGSVQLPTNAHCSSKPTQHGRDDPKPPLSALRGSKPAA